MRPRICFIVSYSTVQSSIAIPGWSFRSIVTDSVLHVHRNMQVNDLILSSRAVLPSFHDIPTPLTPYCYHYPPAYLRACAPLLHSSLCVTSMLLGCTMLTPRSCRFLVRFLPCSLIYASDLEPKDTLTRLSSLWRRSLPVRDRPARIDILENR